MISIDKPFTTRHVCLHEKLALAPWVIMQNGKTNASETELNIIFKI